MRTFAIYRIRRRAPRHPFVWATEIRAYAPSAVPPRHWSRCWLGTVAARSRHEAVEIARAVGWKERELRVTPEGA